MFEQEINETIQRITRDVLQERTILPLTEILEESQIPDRFKFFFETEARWWIYTESVARARDRRFDFSHPELDSLLSYLEQIQVRHARFERDDFTAVLDSAVKLTYNYLCRPQTTLKWYVFRGEPTKPIGETLLRMEAFADYPYFRAVFAEWVERKKVERPTFDSISSKEFERIVRRIDDQILLSCTIDDLLGMMSPVFDFVGKGEAQSVPIEALIVFFDDKNIRKLVDFLERERGTRTHVTRNSFVLLMEELLNNADDEPETDFSSVYQDDALDEVVREHLEGNLGSIDDAAARDMARTASESLSEGVVLTTGISAAPDNLSSETNEARIEEYLTEERSEEHLSEERSSEEETAPIVPEQIPDEILQEISVEEHSGVDDAVDSMAVESDAEESSAELGVIEEVSEEVEDEDEDEFRLEREDPFRNHYDDDLFYIGDDNDESVAASPEIAGDAPSTTDGEPAPIAEESGQADQVGIGEADEFDAFFVNDQDDGDPILDFLIDPTEDERMLPESREEKELDYAALPQIEPDAFIRSAEEPPAAAVEEVESESREEDESRQVEAEDAAMEVPEAEETISEETAVEEIISEERASQEPYSEVEEAEPSEIETFVSDEMNDSAKVAVTAEDHIAEEKEEERIEVSGEEEEENGISEGNETEDAIAEEHLPEADEFKLVEESAHPNDEIPVEAEPGREEEEHLASHDGAEGKEEKGETTPQTDDVRNYIDAMLERKVVKKIFNRNRENYEATLDRLNTAETWREASRILDELFIRFDVDPYSRVAIRFTDSVYGRYLSPVYGG